MMHAHTYFPKAGVFVAGEHDAYVPGMPILARSVQGKPEMDKDGNVAKPGAWRTSNLSASLKKAATVIASLKHQYAQMGPGVLAAADEELLGDFLSPLIQIRLHQQIMGEMQKWFHLDAAYVPIDVDQLLYRMPFQDNPAAAQRVPARQQYDISKVNYYEAFLELSKVVNAYDIAWEDKLRATIDFEPTLLANLDFSMDYIREVDAAKEIQKLENNVAGIGSKTFWNAGTSGTKGFVAKGDAGSLTPAKIGTGVHSSQKSVDIVMDSMNEFTKTSDMHIDTAVCHPRTGMKIAANTWTENNTIFNVEAYRTNGGVRPFPGIPHVSMVMSLQMPEDVLYLYTKRSNVMVLARGPQSMKMWDDPTRFRKVHAKAQFYTYKYMLDGLKTPDGQQTLKRRFGYCIKVDNDTT